MSTWNHPERAGKLNLEKFYLSVHQNRDTAARASNFLLVKCVLKCGVDHTWRRTSAFLNYERFHGH